MTLKVDIEKTIQVVLYILNRLGGKSDFHKLFKIIYFAEQKHICKFGFPILGDTFIAMNNGPVPTTVYDIFKSLRGQGLWQPFSIEFATFFAVENNFHVVAKIKSDNEFMAETELECIEQSINENESLNFGQLTKKSHSSAWEKANANGEISLEDIAREGGAEEEMIKYLMLNIENATLNMK